MSSRTTQCLLCRSRRSPHRIGRTSTFIARFGAHCDALPAFFESELVISGVLATDLFTFNSSLGSTIEAQVTSQLNRLRETWDPDKKYTLYRFVRNPQTFPDVTLRAAAPDVDPPILLGIELKGWYVLAKEKEPSFRMVVNPAVTAPWDLLAVYPWALSDTVHHEVGGML